jgi:hypothetical protein
LQAADIWRCSSPKLVSFIDEPWLRVGYQCLNIDTSTEVSLHDTEYQCVVCHRFYTNSRTYIFRKRH